MQGHTNTATINQRRPLTAKMRQLLRELIIGEVPIGELDQSERNVIRALHERGLATWHIETRRYSVTPAGREAWHE